MLKRKKFLIKDDDLNKIKKTIGFVVLISLFLSFLLPTVNSNLFVNNDDIETNEYKNDYDMTQQNIRGVQQVENSKGGNTNILGIPIWPTNWILIDTDPNEGVQDPEHDRRDVHYAYYNYDADYLYLRLECYGYPNFTEEPDSRYKWFIDFDDNAYYSGHNILEGEWLLFVEDYDDFVTGNDGDGIGDVFLLEDTDYDGDFSEWESPPDYYSAGLVTDPNIAGYRIIDNKTDLYVNLSHINAPCETSLVWATDQENPNLEQGPTLDMVDSGDIPLGPFPIKDMIGVDKKVFNPVTQTWEESIYNAEVCRDLDFSITVTNLGATNVINIELEDDFPSNLLYNYDATGNPTVEQNHHIEWFFSTINAGDSVSVYFSANVTDSIDDYNLASACGQNNPSRNYGPLVEKILITLNSGGLYELFGFYQICDDDSLHIIASNNPPDANDDSASVDEDSSNNQINVLTNDNDPDSDSLIITSITSPTNGLATHDGNYVYYTPDPALLLLLLL
jgi:hypothetical protein